MTRARLALVLVYANGLRWERWPITEGRWLAYMAQLAQPAGPRSPFPARGI